MRKLCPRPPPQNPEYKRKTLAEIIEESAQVECPLDEKDFLKKMFDAGRVLVFSFHPGTYSIKVWYRDSDLDYHKDHSEVDLEAKLYGYTGFVAKSKEHFECYRPSPAQDLAEWDKEKSAIRKKIIDFLG